MSSIKEKAQEFWLWFISKLFPRYKLSRGEGCEVCEVCLEAVLISVSVGHISL